jgi:transglutaminase-like putative cysteine protease/tetratricopeptide (TPR) repeat protein
LPRPNFLFATLGFVFFLLLYPVSISAADNAQPWNVPRFVDDAKTLTDAASAMNIHGGTDAVVLDEEENYVFDEQGRNVHTQYVVYKVLTQRGAEGWADVGYSWEPWHQDRPTLRARVITPDGAIHTLDPATITDAPAKEDESLIYSDRRVIRAPLPAVTPGSIIEEEEITKETSSFFGSGTVARFYFGRPVPVAHSRLLLDAPSSLPLRYTQELLPDMKPQRTEANGRVQILFEASSLDPLENTDSNLPSDVPAYPSVTFSTGNSWKDLAGEYSKIVDDHIASSDIKSLVEGLTRDKKTNFDKAYAILQYVDMNIRYTGVEFGDAAIMPNTPAETMKRKYGDCKDKAVLTVAMLRAAGIPAYVALLSAGQRQDVVPSLPGMGMFDHAIVYVPGKPDMWIDATDEYARLGQLPGPDHGRMALIARPGTDSLTRTPDQTSQENALVEDREFYLAENGPARIIEISRPQGSLESAFRAAYSDKDNKGTKDSLTDYVKAQYLAEKLDRIDRSDPSDLSKQFQLTLECDKARRGYTDLTNAVAAIRLDELFGRLPIELQRPKDDDSTPANSADKPKKQRTNDFQLPYPFVTEWHYKIVPPAGFQPKPLPKDAKITLGPAVLTEEYSADKDGVVHANFRFDTVKGRYTVAEAEEVRSKVVEMRNGEAIAIYFEPIAQALLNQGKYSEAFHEYRGLIAQHPKEAVHHLQIAQALLMAGMGETAREEAQLAVKLEPASALAEKTLGEILEFDVVGRKFRPGSDYVGAEAAFRTAMKLDPDDKTTVGELALLLEYNHEGNRYGPGANLKEAVAVYESLTPEKLAGIGLQNNLPFALMYAGEFAEAKKKASVLNPQPASLMIACEAALDGSQAGIIEAHKRSGNDDEFKQNANIAGQILLNLRKYAEAADLVEAGASGDDSARVVALASMLRKAQPHENITFKNTPADAEIQYFLTSASPDITLDKIKALSSHNAVAVLDKTDPEDIENMLKGGKQMRTMFSRSGSNPDVTLDLMMQAFQPKVDGNDATGYRVIMQVLGSPKATGFVVKENGRYKELGSSAEPGAVGLEILDRVNANNLDGARVLLDWLREEQHLQGGDDPLAGAPFPRFWTKGQEATADQMKLAAAAILVESKPAAAQGVAILEPALAATKSDTEKANIQVALLTGYGYLEDSVKALAICQELAKQHPESKRVFFAEEFAFGALGKFDEADALAKDRLKRMPDDLDALRAQSLTALFRGDFAAAHQLADKVVESGNAEAEDLNQAAWYALFDAKVDDSDVEHALRGAQMSQNNPHILHTLACLYAAMGKTKEARELFIQAMDRQNLDEPDADYWFGFGRIAEQSGESQAAIADYDRVSRPKKAVAVPGSTYQLAQDRLKVLQAEKGGNKVATKN